MHVCVCQFILCVTSMVSCSSLHLQWLGWILPAWLLGKSGVHLLCTDFCPDNTAYTPSILQMIHLGWCRKSALWPRCLTVSLDVGWAHGTELAAPFHLFLTVCFFRQFTLCWFFRVRINGYIPVKRIWFGNFWKHLETPVSILQSLPSHFNMPGSYKEVQKCS